MNMSYITEKYYSKNSLGKVIEWSGKVNDNGTLIINTGQFGNTRQIVNDSIEGKNTGKRNATSKYQQAVKELKAKEKIKVKNGYRKLYDITRKLAKVPDENIYSVLDASLTINKTDANNILKPMKAVQYKANNRTRICQPKINGHRTVSMLIKDIEGMFATGKERIKLLTKSGHEYVLQHITNAMPIEWFDGNTVFDGEVYVHNEILSQIKRRLPLLKIGKVKVDKSSLPSNIVRYLIFDLSIPEVGQLERLKIKDNILKECCQLYYNAKANRYLTSIPQSRGDGYQTITEIVNVQHTIIHSDEEAQKHLKAALASGYEGIILRDMDAEYMFGGRRQNMMKLKGLKHSEFKILDVILKNEDNNRTYVDFRLANDINDLTFDTPTQGTEKDRQMYLDNPDDYIGKRVTLGFGERTINGLPFHIKELTIREEFDMDINDLNIEI